MVLFRPDGRYAFVPSSFTPIRRDRYYQLSGCRASAASEPLLAKPGSQRRRQRSMVHAQGHGQSSDRQRRATLSNRGDAIPAPITNHVTLVDNANGKFAYITIGGLNEVKVYRRGTQPELIATIPTGDLPHGIWHSGNNERVYVGLENSDAVLAIDTLSNKIIATIPIGQTPQALVYVPGAVESAMAPPT